MVWVALAALVGLLLLALAVVAVVGVLERWRRQWVMASNDQRAILRELVADRWTAAPLQPDHES